jgi:2-hydroxychromene-2-carboxylate isomerase
VAAVIAEHGIAPEEYGSFLAGEGAREYAAAQEEAAADHVFGVPIFMFDGEPFWGHDRLPLLERRLADSGLMLSD